MKFALLPLLLLLTACAPSGPRDEAAAWEERAAGITIVRDEWGVPHVYGRTDADAVFGMIYAQAEDDFNRIEVNYLNSQGRLAEAEGESAIWRDLRMKLFIDPADLQAQYAESPAWLRELMDAWAAGLNYYLHTHPDVKPRVLTRFEPWMALSFSEGSIGGDIERVNLAELEKFYAPQDASPPPAAQQVAAAPVRSSLIEPDPDAEPLGSNGFAIAPSNSASQHALLLINPHTSFFFREELQMVSEQGLNAYGAVTWGQFFVYQGFNERAGWMHTSSGVDNIDEFLESVVEQDGERFYRYGDELRPLTTREVVVRYRTDSGMAERKFTVYRTHHGPIVRSTGDKWVSVALMEEPTKALIQSYSRTKARNLAEYLEVMRTHTNSSNNTVFADAEGNIAYLHSNFIPVRSVDVDYTQPVDGSDPATDWRGVHKFEESPNAVNPKSGFVQNTNNHPYSAAGPDSPKPDAYPAYMQTGGENARGVHALRVLQDKRDFTLESLIAAAYDPFLPGFAESIPAVIAAWDEAPDTSPYKLGLADQIGALRGWDLRWGVESIATSLAVFYGEELRKLGDAAKGTPEEKLEALTAASARLDQDFGTWRTPWGEINRFQRVNGDLVQPFDDTKPSTPVAFVSGQWGSLASFGAKPYPGTKRWYGTSGNSFVAVVEFGDRVRARAVTAGGLNSSPSSPHFNDQAERYAKGELRDVHYYREDVEKHAKRTYRPGS